MLHQGPDPGPFAQMASLLLSHPKRGSGESLEQTGLEGVQEALGWLAGSPDPGAPGGREWGEEPLRLQTEELRRVRERQA